MDEFSLKTRTYLAERVKRGRRDLIAAGYDFIQRQRLLSSKATLDVDFAVKSLGSAISENANQKGQGGKESQKRTAGGKGIAEIEPKVRFAPEGTRQPGQILKLHVTAKDMVTGEPNFGWVDPPKEQSEEERKSAMAAATAWKKAQPKIRVRSYDQDPRTGEPILDTEQEIEIKSLGRSLKETLGSGASLAGRAARGLGLIVDDLGKFRCPPGTPAANQFTDSFGSNCFKPVASLRSAVSGAVNAFNRSVSRRIADIEKRQRRSLDQLLPQREAAERGLGGVIGTPETIAAAALAQKTALQDLGKQLGMDFEAISSDSNLDLWALLEAFGEDGSSDLDWSAVFTDAWGGKIDITGLSIKEAVEKRRKALVADMTDFLGPEAEARVAAGDAEAIGFVEALVKRHDAATRGFLASFLHDLQSNPEEAKLVKELKFRNYNPGRDDFKGYFDTDGEASFVVGEADGVAMRIEVNPTALALRDFMTEESWSGDPSEHPKVVMVTTERGGSPILDGDRWEAINDFLGNSAKMSLYERMQVHAADMAEGFVGDTELKGIEMAAAQVGYHEFAHIKQYNFIHKQISDALTRDNHFIVSNDDGTFRKLEGDPSTWNNGEWADAVQRVLYGQIPPNFQDFGFPPVDIQTFEGTMLHILAGKRYQSLTEEYLAATGGVLNENSEGRLSQSEIQQINILLMEGMAELEGLRRVGAIEGPILDDVLGWMDGETVERVTPDEDIEFKPVPDLDGPDFPDPPWYDGDVKPVPMPTHEIPEGINPVPMPTHGIPEGINPVPMPELERVPIRPTGPDVAESTALSRKRRRQEIIDAAKTRRKALDDVAEELGVPRGPNEPHTPIKPGGDGIWEGEEAGVPNWPNYPEGVDLGEPTRFEERVDANGDLWVWVSSPKNKNGNWVPMTEENRVRYEEPTGHWVDAKTAASNVTRRMRQTRKRLAGTRRKDPKNLDMPLNPKDGETFRDADGHMWGARRSQENGKDIQWEAIYSLKEKTTDASNRAKYEKEALASFPLDPKNRQVHVGSDGTRWTFRDEEWVMRGAPSWTQTEDIGRPFTVRQNKENALKVREENRNSLAKTHINDILDIDFDKKGNLTEEGARKARAQADGNWKGVDWDAEATAEGILDTDYMKDGRLNAEGRAKAQAQARENIKGVDLVAAIRSTAVGRADYKNGKLTAEGQAKAQAQVEARKTFKGIDFSIAAGAFSFGEGDIGPDGVPTGEGEAKIYAQVGVAGASIAGFDVGGKLEISKGATASFSGKRGKAQTTIGVGAKGEIDIARTIFGVRFGMDGTVEGRIGGGTKPVDLDMDINFGLRSQRSTPLTPAEKAEAGVELMERFPGMPRDHRDASVASSRSYMAEEPDYGLGVDADGFPVRKNPKTRVDEFKIEIFDGDHEGLARVSHYKQRGAHLRDRPYEMERIQQIIVPADTIDFDEDEMSLTFGGHNGWVPSWNASNGLESESSAQTHSVGREVWPGDELSAAGFNPRLEEQEALRQLNNGSGGMGPRWGSRTFSGTPDDSRAGISSNVRTDQNPIGLRSTRLDDRTGPDLKARGPSLDDQRSGATGKTEAFERSERILADAAEAGVEWDPFSGLTPEERAQWIRENDREAGGGGQSRHVGDTRVGVQWVESQWDELNELMENRLFWAKDTLRVYREGRAENGFDDNPEDVESLEAAIAGAVAGVEYLENNTPQEFYDALAAILRTHYEDEENFLAVQIPSGERLFKFIEEGYKTSHEVRSDHSGADVRRSYEVTQGIPDGTDPEHRPASGYVVSGAFQKFLRDVNSETHTTRKRRSDKKGERYDPFSSEMNTSRSAGTAGVYGQVQLILKEEVKERTKSGFGDSFNESVRAAPMVGATDDQIVDSLLATDGGKGKPLPKLVRALGLIAGGDPASLGHQEATVADTEFTQYGTDGYAEALILGSFNLGDVAIIRIPSTVFDLENGKLDVTPEGGYRRGMTGAEMISFIGLEERGVDSSRLELLSGLEAAVAEANGGRPPKLETLTTAIEKLHNARERKKFIETVAAKSRDTEVLVTSDGSNDLSNPDIGFYEDRVLLAVERSIAGLEQSLEQPKNKNPSSGSLMGGDDSIMGGMRSTRGGLNQRPSRKSTLEVQEEALDAELRHGMANGFPSTSASFDRSDRNTFGMRSRRGPSLEDQRSGAAEKTEAFKRSEEILADAEELGFAWGLSRLPHRERVLWTNANDGIGGQDRDPDRPELLPRGVGVEKITMIREEAVTQIKKRLDDRKAEILRATEQIAEAERAGKKPAYSTIDHKQNMEKQLPVYQKLLEYATSRTDQEIYDDLLAVLKSAHEDEDNILAVQIPSGDRFASFLEDGEYKTTHEVKSSHSDSYARNMFELTLGVPVEAGPELRPASGYILSAARQERAKSDLIDEGLLVGNEVMNEDTGELQDGSDLLFFDGHNRSLPGGTAIYGNIQLRLKPEVKKRTQSAFGDSFRDRNTPTPLVGATDDEIVGALTDHGDPLRAFSLAMSGDPGEIADFDNGSPYAKSEKPYVPGGETYVEALILGSFDLEDVDQIVMETHLARKIVLAEYSGVAYVPPEERVSAVDEMVDLLINGLDLDPDRVATLRGLLKELEAVNFGGSENTGSPLNRSEMPWGLNELANNLATHKHRQELQATIREKSPDTELILTNRWGVDVLNEDRYGDEHAGKDDPGLSYFKSKGPGILEEAIADITEDLEKAIEEKKNPTPSSGSLMGGIRSTRGGSKQMRSRNRETQIQQTVQEQQLVDKKITAVVAELRDLRKTNPRSRRIDVLGRQVNQLHHTRSALKSSLKKLTKERNRQTRGRSTRQISTRTTSGSPTIAKQMATRNTAIDKIKENAFAAPENWATPKRLTLPASETRIPIQSRNEALVSHKQKLAVSFQDLEELNATGTLAGPDGKVIQVDPVVSNYMADKTSERVTSAAMRAAATWHRGFDRKPRVALDENELDDLLSTGTHLRSDAPYGENSATDLRSVYDLSNGIKITATNNQRPVSGHLYHATHDDAIEKHLNDLDGPLMERDSDFWDPSGQSPWGNPDTLGGEIDLVLHPESSNRTHYTRGSGMSGGAPPVSMNSDNHEEILAALTPTRINGTEQGSFANTERIHDLLLASLTGNYKTITNKTDNPLNAPEYHQAQILGGVEIGDIKYVRYPISKTNWKSRKLTAADVGENNATVKEKLVKAGFSETEIAYFYNAVRDGRVSGLHNVNWLRQSLAAEEAEERFIRTGVNVKFTNPDGIDLLNPDTFMSGLVGTGITGASPQDILRKRIQIEIVSKAETLLVDLRKEMKPKRTQSQGVLV
jgi:hypothetical protein